jgi:predicted helicase
VKAYLLLEPEYASKLKQVWLHREVPGTVAEKLKLPGGDQGIDIVAETNDREFWAVQLESWIVVSWLVPVSLSVT